MNGIIINIDPVILQVGGFELRWYSVAIILAIAAAMLIGAREGQRKGIPSAEIYSLGLLAVMGGLVGARLFHVIDYFGYYASNPFQILQFQGLAIWGGLAGGGLVAVVYAKLKHMPLSRVADAVVPALLTAQMIGRLGCIINGDAYGGVTGLPWGFVYVHPNALIPSNLFGVPTHPYPVYEILWNTAVLLVILRLRHYLKTDGLLFVSYLALYSLGRFVLSFVRQENEVLWGLQQAQVLALVAVAMTALVFFYVSRKPTHKTLAEGSQQL